MQQHARLAGSESLQKARVAVELCQCFLCHSNMVRCNADLNSLWNIYANALQVTLSTCLDLDIHWDWLNDRVQACRRMARSEEHLMYIHVGQQEIMILLQMYTVMHAGLKNHACIISSFE